MKTATELLQPINQLVTDYRRHTIDKFNGKIRHFTNESVGLQNQLDEHYRFDPVAIILEGQPLEMIANNILAITKKEQLVEALSAAIEKIRIDQNASISKIPPVMSRISTLTASALNGKTAILGMISAQPDVQVPPTEIATFRATINALRGEFAKLNAITPVDVEVNILLAEINTITSHRTMDEIA